MKHFTPQISVIMSVYNEPIEYLRGSIQSILNQTFSNIEFVIVLDSPQNIEIKEYLEEICISDRRVKIVINDYNMGLTKSLNRALEYANGDYIARMDADDISLENRLEKELDLLLSSGSDLVASKIMLIDSHGKKLGIENTIEFDQKKLEKLLKVMNYMPHPTWLGKRELFLLNKGYRDVPTCEDYDFILRAIKNGARLNIDNTPRLLYRINENGITRSNPLRQLLTTYYLSKNFDYIEDCLEGLDLFLNKYMTKKAVDRYNRMVIVTKEKGHCYIRSAARFILYPEMRLLYERKIRIRKLFKTLNI